MSHSNRIVLSRVETNNVISHFVTKSFLAAFLVFVVAVFKFIREGSTNDAFILLAGSVLSPMALVGYALLPDLAKSKPRRKLYLVLQKSLLMLFPVGGLIPWLFSIYLVLYKGLWQLIQLLQGFSGLVIVRAIFFIIVGLAIVKGTYEVTEFVRKVNEGQIVVE